MSGRYVTFRSDEIVCMDKIGIFTPQCTHDPEYQNILFCNTNGGVIYLPMKTNISLNVSMHADKQSFCKYLSADWFCMLNVYIPMEVMLYMLITPEYPNDIIQEQVAEIFSHIEGMQSNGNKNDISMRISVHPMVVYEKPLRSWLKHITSIKNMNNMFKQVRKHKCKTLHHLGKMLTSMHLPSFFCLFFIPHKYFSFCPAKHIQMLSSNPAFVSQNLKHVTRLNGVHTILDSENMDVVHALGYPVFNFQDPHCLRKWAEAHSTLVLDEIECDLMPARTRTTNQQLKREPHEQQLKHEQDEQDEQDEQHVKNLQHVQEHALEYSEAIHAPPLKSPKQQRKDLRQKRPPQTSFPSRIPPLKRNEPRRFHSPVLEEGLSHENMCERDKMILQSEPITKPYMQLWQRKRNSLSILGRAVPTFEECTSRSNIPVNLLNEMRDEMKAIKTAFYAARDVLENLKY